MGSFCLYRVIHFGLERKSSVYYNYLMKGRPELSKNEQKEIVELRERGHSLNEIKKITGKANSTVLKYIKGVEVLSDFREVLRLKQGGSKSRSLLRWNFAKEKAEKLISGLEKKDKLIILACLYWGEGNKRELDLINSDPSLVKCFVNCLYNLGVSKESLRITVRIYEDMDKNKVINFWASLLEVKPSVISNVNILKGRKKGKLEHGMCRVRVAKGAEYFKLVISMINLIRDKLSRYSSMDRTRHS